MPRNPFDDEPTAKPKVNPFGDDDGGDDPVGRIEHSARTIRRLRSRLGAEGLTPSATRELIDELTAALDAIVRALKHG